MESNLDIKTMLEDMQSHIEKQSIGIAAVKDTARSIFGAASLIVALIGALQVFDAPVPDGAFGVVYRIGVVLIMILYPLLIVLCLKTLAPVIFYGPIKPELEILRETYTGKDEREILKQRLVNCLNVIPKNEAAIQKRRKLVNASGVVLVFIVIIMLGVSVIA